MRHLVLFFIFSIIVSGVFAQDKSPAELKNEGNGFLKKAIEAKKAKNAEEAKKNYNSAFKLFEQYLGVAETDDAPVVYNAAVCAYQSADYDNAVKYFNQAITMKYKKAAAAYLYVAKSYKKKKDLENYEKTLIAGIAAFQQGKSSDKMKKMLGTYYAKQGLTVYNEGNKLKVNSINLGNSNDQADKDKAPAEKEKAVKKLTEAMTILEKSYNNYPKEKNVIKALADIYTFLEMADKAKAMNEALETPK